MRSPHFYYAHLAIDIVWYLVYYNNCKEVIPKEEILNDNIRITRNGN